MQQRDQPVYIITERTQALYKSESSYYKTEILENVKRKKSRLSSLEIIDYSCIVQGSSTLKGRIESVINTFQIHNKVPIMINPVKGIYLFPTASIRSPHCVWLSYYHVYSYHQDGAQCYIEFTNGEGMYVAASENTIKMQRLRTSLIIAQVNKPYSFEKVNSPFTIKLK
ncbi:competence protein ComK [Virgibacillus soli]|uniref:competence protein ComK n=1 Tax=Paracerasibacillus soli TaxID=480284 RepID=UPI0035E4A9AB